MVRRTTTVIAAVAIAIAGAFATTAPAQAGPVVAPPVVSAATPCPLTPAQLAYGRQTIADALATLNRGSAALTGGSPYTWTATPSTDTSSSVSACLLALQDVQSKKLDLDAANAEYLGCVLVRGSSGCSNEFSNASSKLHDLQVALNNLKYACPWLGSLVG